MKASTSTTRGKATARAEDAIEVEDDPQPAKSNKLTASTSGKKKKVYVTGIPCPSSVSALFADMRSFLIYIVRPAKRSATETSIAEEAVSQSVNDAHLDETIQDVDETMSIKEGKKPAKAATKSRKSKAAIATTTATKKGAAKAAKGKAEAAAVAASTTVPDSIVDLASDSEADAPPPPPSPPTKPATKPRKRTTRATSEVASAVAPQGPQEPEKTKNTRSTSSRSRSKKAPQGEEGQTETESIAPSEIGLTTENEREPSEAEPLQNKRSTRSKLAKSTSSAESRSTRANGKKADNQTEVEMMSVSEASEVEKTVAKESKVLTKKASSAKSTKSTRSTSASSRKTTSKPSIEESQSIPLQSDIVPNATEISKATNVVEDTQEGETLPVKKATKKAAAPRQATKSKSTKRSTLAASSTRSTRSGHASDSVVQSESETSYATQTDDETMEETRAEMTRDEPSFLEIMDASTPKAIIKGGVRSEETKMALPAIHHDTASKDQDTQVHHPDVPPRREAQEAQTELKQLPQTETIEPAPTGPQVRPERTVKSLPARRSRGESPVVSLPAPSSIFAEKRANQKSSATSMTSAAQPMPSREALTRGQSALDALLAGPNPTFDSPEKTSNPSQATKPVSRPAPASAPLAPASPAMKQAPRSANVLLDDKTTVKEWLAVLRQQEMDRFDIESRKLLADFDKQTQKKRNEVRSSKISFTMPLFCYILTYH